MSSSSNANPTLATGKKTTITESHDNGVYDYDEIEGETSSSTGDMARLERKLVRKVDWRLCTIAGVLCSLNLLDSGIISWVTYHLASLEEEGGLFIILSRSASVTSIFQDLGLGVGNRYVSLLGFLV
jgi:hypothetical protein